MGEEIGFENGRNSNYQGLVTLTLDPAYRRGSLIDLYLHTKFHWDRKKKFFESHHWGFGQVQSHATQKLGQISKIRPDEIEILCSSLRISGHLPALIVNGGGDRFWKLKEFKLSRARDLDLDLDLGSGHTAYRRASLIDLYLHTKFHWDWKKFFSKVTTEVLVKFRVTWHKN